MCCQASEEQLHIASRIGESHTIPADIKDKIQQVASIVLDKTEDEICITLHDNNFDPEATISALLDSDNFKVSFGSVCYMLGKGCIGYRVNGLLKKAKVKRRQINQHQMLVLYQELMQ